MTQSLTSEFNKDRLNQVVTPSELKPFISFKSLLIKAFAPVYLIFILSDFSEQFINFKIEALIKNTDAFSHKIWIYAALSIILSFCFPIIMILFNSYFAKKLNKDLTLSTLKKFFIDRFELALLESLRSYGLIFLNSFLLIIPGILRFFDYLLVPFVSCLSNRYLEGQVNALELSKKIFRENKIIFIFLFLIFQILIPLFISTIFDEYQIFSKSPLTAPLFTALDTFLLILFHFIIFKLINPYVEEN